jgi:hypothetical protein
MDSHTILCQTLSRRNDESDLISMAAATRNVRTRKFVSLEFEGVWMLDGKIPKDFWEPRVAHA